MTHNRNTPEPCADCGKPSDGWPDEEGGELCQDCWEEQCNRAFWKAVEEGRVR